MICDLAEVYHIYDYRQLPPSRVATFVLGLSPDSRVMRELTGTKLPLAEMLLAGIADRLTILLHALNGSKKKPELILDTLNERDSDITAFTTGEDFEKERQRIIREVNNGN